MKSRHEAQWGVGVQAGGGEGRRGGGGKARLTCNPELSVYAAEHGQVLKLERVRDGMRRTRRMLMRKDRKSTRLNSSHSGESRMPSSA